MLQWVVYQQKLAKPLQIQITIGKPYNEFSNQIPDYCQKVISPFSGVMINNIKKEHRQETPNSVGKGFMREQLCGPADIQDSKLRDTEANLMSNKKTGWGDRDPHFVRACAVEMDMWTYHKSHSMRKFSGKTPPPKTMRRPRPTLCASLRSRNGHGHITRAILRENSQEKRRRPKPQSKFTWARKPDGAP